MKALNDLNIFVETARQGGFSQAAHGLNLTPAAVSAAIKRLESQLGFALFVRSTRSLRLTAEGDIFLTQTTSALQILQDGLDMISEAKGELSGTISLSAPSDLGRNQLLDWLDEFMTMHPKVSIRLELSDSITNMYSKPIDVAIRYGIPPDSNLVALPLCKENIRVACASPTYIKNSPQIVQPTDLLSHHCLCFMLSGSYHNKWVFWKNGQVETVSVSGQLAANDGDAVRQWAIKGKGVAYKSLLDISQDLIDGSLISLLPDWQSEVTPVYLVCADKRLMSPTTRALHQFLQQKCEQQLRHTIHFVNGNTGGQ
ncbi:LysR family transcriptional regulator [Vibrio aestuarianus]|uniref:LysR family transcriptional regulator n=1 Tax=Vibrio aestuarianus TaxID=28171 RepID=UPI00237C91EE|nr:LysR family transcriptional regulator [Vibrio aestuarianus]MDE1238968.1 LysR family transcriptional regulator [Vibrio aestuarianus]